MSGFLEDWHAQIRHSVVEFTSLWINAREVDLTHGLLPAAILWPIRQSVKDFELDTMNTVQEIAGDNTKLILRDIQSWGDDRLVAARSLAAQSAGNPELGMALDKLNTYFDAVSLFANTIAQTTVAQRGNGNVYNISGQIKAGLLNIGGQLNVDSLTLNLEQLPSQAEIAEQQQQRYLLKRVKDIWITGVLANSLHNKVMIELGKETLLEAIERPWEQVLETPSGQRFDFPPDRNIQDIFDEMGYAMLILGAPGAGKTTMLLELARSSVLRAEETPGHPIPVVFNLSSWTIRRPPFGEWLVDELNSIYGIPTRLGKVWVEQNVLMLLLDGLDEVQAEHRAACVDAINAFRTEHGIAYIAICSRVGEYEALTKRLKLNGAIVLLPLTSEQIVEYFTTAGSQFDAVRAALQIDHSLQELARSPLMLSIMAMAYADETVEMLTNVALNSTETRRKHLFDIYVQKMFIRRRRNKRFSDQKMSSWLQWLALQMQRHSQSTFLIERLQPTWLPVFWQRVLYKLIQIDLTSPSLGKFIVGAVIFASIISCVATATGVDGLLGLTLLITVPIIVIVLIWSFALAIQALTTWLLSGNVASVETLNWSWENFRKKQNKTTKSDGINEQRENWLTPTIGVLVYILFGGLLLVLPVTSWYTLLLVTLLLVLGIVLLFKGLVFGRIETTKIPNEGIQRSVRNAMIVGIWGCLGVTPMAMFLGNIMGNWLYFNNGWQIGLGLGMVVGILGWLQAGGWAFIYHFVLRIMIWSSGYLPLNLTGFLDYATERIFLQKIGGGYAFTHRLLMEYFALIQIEKKGPMAIPVRDWLGLVELSNVDIKSKKAPLDAFLEENPWARLIINQGGVFLLLTLFYKASWSARVSAASNAVQLGIANSELVKGLYVSLKDKEQATRKRAISILGQLGTANNKVLADLVFALYNADSQISSGAALALGRSETENKEVVAGLLTALGNEDRNVHACVVEALAELGLRNNEVVPGLLNALQNGDFRMRAGSALALGQLCSQSKRELNRGKRVGGPRWGPSQASLKLMNSEQVLQVVNALHIAYDETSNSQLENILTGEMSYPRVKDVIEDVLQTIAISTIPPLLSTQEGHSEEEKPIVVLPNSKEVDLVGKFQVPDEAAENIVIGNENPQITNAAIYSTTKSLPRHVLNAGFAFLSNHVIKFDESLSSNHFYDLLVDVGPKWNISQSIVNESEKVYFPIEKLPANQLGYHVRAEFTSEDFSPKLCIAELWVSAEQGPSYPFANGKRSDEPGPVKLRVRTPRLRFFVRERRALGYIRLYYKDQLIQSGLVSVGITKFQSRKLEELNTIELDYALTSDFEETKGAS